MNYPFENDTSAVIKKLAVTREVVKAVKVPVTVKTRLGWNSDNLRSVQPVLI